MHCYVCEDQETNSPCMVNSTLKGCPEGFDTCQTIVTYSGINNCYLNLKILVLYTQEIKIQQFYFDHNIHCASCTSTEVSRMNQLSPVQIIATLMWLP